MINKTEQEVDYSINQLVDREESHLMEGYTYPIEFTIGNHTWINMCVITKDKNGKLISKLIPNSGRNMSLSKYYEELPDNTILSPV